MSESHTEPNTTPNEHSSLWNNPACAPIETHVFDHTVDYNTDEKLFQSPGIFNYLK